MLFRQQNLSETNMLTLLEKKETHYLEGTFPVKLHQMLESVSDSELSAYVCWDPNGLSFSITNPKVFANEIMGNFFNQTRYKSFQRQLNFYGFHRSCRGKIRGVYTHPMFRRDQPELCNQMKRLDSRDFKKDKTFKKLAKPTPALPSEITINMPVPAFDFQPVDMDFSTSLHSQDNCQSNDNDNNKSLHSLFLPHSTSSTCKQSGIETSIRTQATSVETNSDCDCSIGTIDVLPSTYLSWETSESFEDGLFQST